MEFKVPATRTRTAEQRPPPQPTPPPPTVLPPPPPPPPPPPVPTPSSSSPYTPPLWSSVALHPYSLSVLRRGVELESFPLTSHPYYTVGRLPPPHSLLSLAHPSISRHHAVLQHRDDGRLFVLDRGSSHGTKVNKRRIPAHEYVELHVGDLMAFGDSERLYLVEGPDDLRVPEKELRRRGPPPPPSLPVEAKVEATAEEVEERGEERKGDEEDFATWGMREDGGDEEAEEEVDPSDPSSALYSRVSQYLLGVTPSLSSSDMAALNDGQLGIVQRVERRRQKALNMAEEVETLQGKERKQGSLTDGQQAQMERNEKRIEDLQATILDDLEALKAALLSRHPAVPTARRRRADTEDADDDSDDDFFDRTLAKKREGKAQSTNAAVAALPGAGSAVSPLSALLPLESLTTAAAVCAQLRRCEELRDALRVVLRDVTPVEDAAAAVDSLDAFMGQVEEQRKAEKMEKVKGELRQLQRHFEALKTRLKEREAEERVHRLRQHEAEADTAAAATNSLRLDEKEETKAANLSNGASGATKSETNAPKLPAAGGVADALARVRRAQLATIPSPSTSTPAAKPAPIGPAIRPSDGPSVSPAASSDRTATPPSSSSSLSDLARRLDAARASTSAQSPGDSSISAALKRRMEGTGQGGVVGEGGGLLLANAKRRMVERDRGEATEDRADDEQSSFDMEWKPPVNQTGDGRTAHNARLGY